MAGLLYLPRLFVNHANPEITKETSETFKLMEGKLYRIIMFPAFIVWWISGFTLTHYVGIDTWLLLKILFVILLSGYHFFCLKCLNDFKNDKNKYSIKFFRMTNEGPKERALIAKYCIQDCNLVHHLIQGSLSKYRYFYYQFLLRQKILHYMQHLSKMKN